MFLTDFKTRHFAILGSGQVMIQLVHNPFFEALIPLHVIQSPGTNHNLAASFFLAPFLHLLRLKTTDFLIDSVPVPTELLQPVIYR